MKDILVHPVLEKSKQKLGAFSFVDAILDRLSYWLSMCPEIVIVQNTKRKSGYTPTMYMDEEVEGKFFGMGSFTRDEEMGKEK